MDIEGLRDAGAHLDLGERLRQAEARAETSDLDAVEEIRKEVGGWSNYWVMG